MAIQDALNGTGHKTSLDETVKIMDEMNRLINEMKETMDIIKRILGEEANGEAIMSSGEGKTRFGSFECFIHSS